MGYAYAYSRAQLKLLRERDGKLLWTLGDDGAY